jgi:flagellar basal-body rod protein FlgG
MFDSIMRLAASNANTQVQALADVSINVSNMQTTGYKNKRFEYYLTMDNRLVGKEITDTAQGDRALTNRPLDICIEGPGYIPVTQPDGATAYTRAGGLEVNSQGYIVTKHGDLVGDGIKLPADYKSLHIDEDGKVSVKTSKSGLGYDTVGKIKLVNFRNAAGLKDVGYNKLVPTTESGEPLKDKESLIQQHSLERSNTDIHEEVERVLRLNASIISNYRIIKFSDDLYRQSVNLRQ